MGYYKATFNDYTVYVFDAVDMRWANEHAVFKAFMKEQQLTQVIEISEEQAIRLGAIIDGKTVQSS